MSGKYSFSVPKDDLWIRRLLNWANEKYPYFAYFRNNQVSYPHGGFDHRFFAGQKLLSMKEAELNYGVVPMVAILSYDFKNHIENLKSENPGLLEIPDSLFFQPELEIHFEKEKITLYHGQGERLFREIEVYPLPRQYNPTVVIVPLTDHQSYLSNIRAIRDHIREGDIYEMNYCIGFTFEEKDWDPLTGFWALMEGSPMPFSVLFRAESQFLICASPERFLKKEENHLIAQPIKGTLKRGNSPEEDLLHRKWLQLSEKERAENLMIVDLMRNDLSKISQTGSVSVEELFGVYPFPRVWQMISTVRSVAKSKLGLRELIHATFPMGSMTGAPKIKCMQLIENYENFKRGWFSGTVGYIEANGNLDLNVIIRSIVFDRGKGNGYFAVGSAITYDADAEYEYQECYLKAAVILEILTHSKI